MRRTAFYAEERPLQRERRMECSQMAAKENMIILKMFTYKGERFF